MRIYHVQLDDETIIIENSNLDCQQLRMVIPTGDQTIFENMLEAALRIVYMNGRNDLLREMRSQCHAK